MNPWRDAPTLVGRHVTLRPLEPDDRDALIDAAKGLTDLFFASVSGLRDPDAFMARTWTLRDQGRSFPLAVVAPDGGVVGLTSLTRMNEAHRRVEIGHTFYARSAQRSGVNTEAKLMLLRHAFDALGCNAVEIRTDWLNRASQRAIERLGAKRDGVLRSHQIMDGRVRDIVVYSIIACEWPGIRQNLEHLLQRGD